jgi:hypothetical protein
MSQTRFHLTSTLAWLRTWTGTTQLGNAGATTVARHTGARC